MTSTIKIWHIREHIGFISRQIILECKVNMCVDNCNSKFIFSIAISSLEIKLLIHISNETNEKSTTFEAHSSLFEGYISMNQCTNFGIYQLNARRVSATPEMKCISHKTSNPRAILIYERPSARNHSLLKR